MWNDLIFVVLAVPESTSRLARAHFGPDLHRRNCGRQSAHAHQIVGPTGEGEKQSTLHSLRGRTFRIKAYRFQPAEAFLDTLPFSLAHGVARVPRSATINGSTATAFVDLRHMGGDPQVSGTLSRSPASNPLSPLKQMNTVCPGSRAPSV